MHPFFYAYHLTEVIFRYPTLKNIILSVWEPRLLMTLTFFLLCVMNYFTAIATYMWFKVPLLGNCDSLLYCFLWCLDANIKGAISAKTAQINPTPNNAEFYGLGYWFYLQFTNLFLSIVMIGVLGGIIIDTFKKLRHEENDKNEDMNNKCFICGNIKQIFDRKQSQKQGGGGYQQHIELNHYMWNYLSFISFIRWKNQTEYSGIESYVNSKLEDDDLSWIPFNRAKELEDDSQSKQDNLQDIINHVDKDLDDIGNGVNEISRLVKMNDVQY